MLLQQEDGLIPKLIEKMEIDLAHFTENAKNKLAARVKVSGRNPSQFDGTPSVEQPKTEGRKSEVRAKEERRKSEGTGRCY